MIRGINTAIAGMLTQQQRQDILTNNLANINTPGYKAKEAIMRGFPEVLINAIRLPNNQTQQIGTLYRGVFIEESLPVFLQGDVVETGVASNMAIVDQDLAIDPDTGSKPTLFFTVEDQNQNRYYTRSGLFTEDAAGQLVTPEGHLVLDDYGFAIQVDGRPYTINEKGVITFSDGETIRVGLTKINNVNNITNIGNQLYSYNGDDNELDFVEEEENYQLYQGRIERSNVDPTQTMIDMMTALRLYEANQQVVQSLDRTLEKAVNEIGRV